VSLLREIRLGPVKTRNNLFLAPLAGIGDSAFRIVGAKFGAGLTFTEMVSANGLVRRNAKTFELMRITEEERPAAIQLFGSDPVVMGEAAALCAEATGDARPDLIDINCGCSVRKVMKNGAGAALLGRPNDLFRIVRACVDASLCAVSVKMRLGLSEDSIRAVENGIAAQEAGASLVTLHPRTARQGFSGRARWGYIALLKRRLRIPVCGNGDITRPQDAVDMIRETGCDAVMVGRGAMGNPWLLADIVNALQTYPGPAGESSPTRTERASRALEHLELIISFKGPERGVCEAKRHIHRYLRFIRGAARVRESLMAIKTADEMRERLRSLIDE